KARSGKGVRWAIEPDSIGRSHLDSIRSVHVFCLSILDYLSDSKSRGGWLNDLGYGSTHRTSVGVRQHTQDELRMVLVKPRSREGSVNERLCNVWLDDARDELVIVYETIKKLCIGSHVSK
ncbi:unnamed protein product, partial [Brassica rapa]